MDNLMTLISALLFGVSAGLLALFVLRSLSMVEVEGSMNEEARRGIPVMFRLAMPLVPNFRGLARTEFFRGWREIAEPRLWMAGYGDSIGGIDFVALRIMFIGIGLISLLLSIFAGYPVAGILLALVLVIYPGVWLNNRIRRRHMNILKALPNVLDLLTLSVEAGKDFVTSLRDILQRRRVDALGEELLRTFQEIQLGRKRTEALRDLAKRVSQSDLTSVVNAIIQAEELGVSIGQLLRIQGDMLRNKRFTMAEKLANETPVKIIGPIILFIFPAVFIVLIVPIGMKLMQVML